MYIYILHRCTYKHAHTFFLCRILYLCQRIQWTTNNDFSHQQTKGCILTMVSTVDKQSNPLLFQQRRPELQYIQLRGQTVRVHFASCLFAFSFMAKVNAGANLGLFCRCPDRKKNEQFSRVHMFGGPKKINQCTTGTMPWRKQNIQSCSGPRFQNVTGKQFHCDGAGTCVFWVSRFQWLQEYSGYLTAVPINDSQVR